MKFDSSCCSDSTISPTQTWTWIMVLPAGSIHEVQSLTVCLKINVIQSLNITDHTFLLCNQLQKHNTASKLVSLILKNMCMLYIMCIQGSPHFYHK